MLYSVAKIPHGGSCHGNDVCMGDNSRCLNGQCTCDEAFYWDLVSQKCSKSERTLTLRFVSLNLIYLADHVFRKSCVITICILISPIFAEPKGYTGSPCLANDVCRDANAVCFSNLCVCAQDFYDDGGICSKLTKTMNVSYHEWLNASM